MYTTVIREGNLCSTVSGEGKWCTTDYSSQEEGNWSSIVLWRRAMGLYLSGFLGFLGFIYINLNLLSAYLDKRFHTDNG